MASRPTRPTFLQINSPLTNPRLLNRFSSKNRTSPTDSGVFSINSYDDRTPLTPSDISPFYEKKFNFNNTSELKSPDQFGCSTFNSPIYKPTNNRYGSPLARLSNLNELKDDSDAAYEFDAVLTPTAFTPSPVIERINLQNNADQKHRNDFNRSIRRPSPVTERVDLLDNGNYKYRNNFAYPPAFTPSPMTGRFDLLDNENYKYRNDFNRSIRRPSPVTERVDLLDNGNYKYRSNFSYPPVFTPSPAAQQVNRNFNDEFNNSFINQYEQCDDNCNACTIKCELEQTQTNSIDLKQCDQCHDELNKFYNLMNLADKIYEANYHDQTYNAESIIDPGTNLPIFYDTKFCRFCKNNKEKSEVYLSHTTRNKAGETTCPVLMRYTCEECGATGKDAHTRSYCPISREAIKNDDLSVAMRCSNMNPVVKSQ